jgi:hypothetical protein
MIDLLGGEGPGPLLGDDPTERQQRLQSLGFGEGPPEVLGRDAGT